MKAQLLGGMAAGVLALTLAGCSSSATSTPTTVKSSTSTTSTSTTLPATTTTGASSPEVLANQFVAAIQSKNTSAFCTTYAVPDQVSACAGDFSSGGVSFKDWKVGVVSTQGMQAVISFTGTACQGSQCVSNSDPKSATDPESSAYVGSSFDALFAAANDPNSQNSSPFLAAAVQQGGAWYASGF